MGRGPGSKAGRERTTREKLKENFYNGRRPCKQRDTQGGVLENQKLGPFASRAKERGERASSIKSFLLDLQEHLLKEIEKEIRTGHWEVLHVEGTAGRGNRLKEEIY